MKYLYLLPLGIALMTVSCKNNPKTASTNPYQNNPYYGPSGSNYGNSTTDYSTSSNANKYPSYSDSAYTPPTSNNNADVSLPSVPSVPAYSGPAPSYSNPTPTYSGTTTSGSYSQPSSGGSTHTVAPGENLYRISLKYSTKVAAIKSANGMASDTIHPGQVLRIP